MPMLATLAKARLNTESIKGSNLVAVRQYMNNKHNLLYKSWTAGLRRCRKR
jgi:hypothetical protein